MDAVVVFAVFAGAILLVAFLIAVLAAAPVAAFNRIRGRGFRVSKRTRWILYAAALPVAVLVVVTVVSPTQDYTERAQVSEGMSLTSQYKTSLTEYFAEYKSFDGVDIGALGGTWKGKYVDTVFFDRPAGGRIAVVARFGNGDNVGEHIRGREFRIATLDGGQSWHCGTAIPDPALRGTNQVDAEFMPRSCKP